MIKNDHFAARWQIDQAFGLHSGKLAADSFDSQAQHIGHLLTRKWQRKSLQWQFGRITAAWIDQPFGHFQQEGRQFLTGLLAPQQQHPAPGPVEFCQGPLQQLVFQRGVLARKSIEITA